MWIGLYDFGGAIVILGGFKESFADKLLRQGTQVITEPYTHGAYGPLSISPRDG